ncbi:MAG: YncE family protein [Terriglobales bacterium]
MKQALILTVFAAASLLTSCGNNYGSSNTTTTTPTTSNASGQVSGIQKRVFLTNQFLGQVDIIDASNDTMKTLLTFTTTGAASNSLVNVMSIGLNPTFMVLTPDKKFTVVFDAGRNQVDAINNSQEFENTALQLAGPTESIVTASDSKSVYIAIPTASVSGQPSGTVQPMDMVTPIVGPAIPVPGARRLALSHDGKTVLAFANDTNNLYVVIPSTSAVTTLSGFDRPTNAVFSSDDSKAYILNCGPECGGTTASIAVLNMATNTVTNTIPVSAATVGFLNGTALYVAGTSAAGGRLDVVDTGTLAVTKSGVVIGDGFHQLMALASNNKLFIGARSCTAGVGCLSIFDATAGSAVIPSTASNTGDVTSVQPISGRNAVYVVQSGELVIYDTTTNAPQATQFDIVGKAYGVLQVDP